MTWFKVDDQLHDHKKVRRLGRDKLPAIGLWSLGGSWAADNLTDGFIPAEIVQRWDPTERYAGRLVEVGLWEPTTQDGEEGYLYHDWDDQQPLREEVLAKRDAARERMRRVRQNRQARSEERSPDVRANEQANESRTSREVRLTPSRPDPSRPSSSSNSSTTRAVADALGLDDDDEDVKKVINLIREENQPTALGPYVRALAAAGDLPAFLERVREDAQTEADADDGIIRRPGDHPWNPDNDGECHDCVFPQNHRCHQAAERRLRVVPDSA